MRNDSRNVLRKNYFPFPSNKNINYNNIRDNINKCNLKIKIKCRNNKYILMMIITNKNNIKKSNNYDNIKVKIR